MKKFIFALAFILCTVFGANATNSKTLSVPINHSALLSNHTSIELSYQNINFGWIVTINVYSPEGRLLGVFSGAGDTFDEALSQALEHWVEWELYG